MKKIIFTACCALVTVGLTQSARALNWTATGSNLNSSDTYDGTSDPNPDTIGGSTYNNYIGNGGTGSLTVQNGSLTINTSDLKIGQNSGGNGTITVQSTGTLNINNVGQWSPGVGQAGGIGVLGIAGTLNWNISGSSEQRLMVGNGAAGNGTVNLTGNLNVSTTLSSFTDKEAQFRVGSDGGAGVLNLYTGTLMDSLPLAFAMAGKYSGTTFANRTFASSATSYGTMNIIDGIFEMTGFDTTFSATQSTFTLGANAIINFTGSGALSLNGWADTDFQALVSSGKVQINGVSDTTWSDYNFSTSGTQGILTAAPVPEPSTLAMVGCGFLLFGAVARNRKR